MNELTNIPHSIKDDVAVSLKRKQRDEQYCSWLPKWSTTQDDEDAKYADWTLTVSYYHKNHDNERAVGYKQEEIYSIHRIIIGPRSEYFERLFSGIFSESVKNSSILDLPNYDNSIVTLEDFEMLLNYCYNPESLKCSTSNAVGILYLGDYLGIIGLVDRVQNFIGNDLNENNRNDIIMKEIRDKYYQSAQIIKMYDVQVSVITKAYVMKRPTNDSNMYHVMLYLNSKKKEIEMMDLIEVYSPDQLQFLSPMGKVLDYLLHVIIQKHESNIGRNDQDKIIEETVVDLLKTFVRFIFSQGEETIIQSTEQLSFLVHQMTSCFNKMIDFRRTDTYKFYDWYRSFILKLMTSKLLQLQSFGLEEIVTIIDRSDKVRPPARSIIVTGAGTTFVNGVYCLENDAQTLHDRGFSGLWSLSNTFIYERVVPVDAPDGGGKKLTLFRCNTRSQQKLWFVSECDEQQPGSDRDIDYYRHKSKEGEGREPSRTGWRTCNIAVGPPPKLKPTGFVTPPGEERNTLQHQLAKWVIENDIIKKAKMSACLVDCDYEESIICLKSLCVWAVLN